MQEEGIPEEEYNLEYCMEEGGTRGEILGLGKESHTMSHRGENLAQ
jgi:hypothetical protein